MALITDPQQKCQNMLLKIGVFKLISRISRRISCSGVTT